MVLCSQPIVGKNPPALGHPRCHVLCNITPPSPLHLHLVQSVTPKSDFVCFVDYIAMSAHSEFLYEINLETSRLDSAAKVHTPIQKLSLLVSCPPGFVSSYAVASSSSLPNTCLSPALARQSTRPSSVFSPSYPPPPLSTRRKPANRRSYSAATLLGDPLIKDVW